MFNQHRTTSENVINKDYRFEVMPMYEVEINNWQDDDGNDKYQTCFLFYGELILNKEFENDYISAQELATKISLLFDLQEDEHLGSDYYVSKDGWL